MIAEEGLDARWQRHERLADAVRAAVTAWSTLGGLGFVARDANQRSHSVTSIATGDIDATEVMRICRESLGVTLGLGIGAADGASFRIGHMGHVSAATVLAVVGAIETALHRMDAPMAASGVGAATALLASS